MKTRKMEVTTADDDSDAFSKAFPFDTPEEAELLARASAEMLTEADKYYEENKEEIDREAMASRPEVQRAQAMGVTLGPRQTRNLMRTQGDLSNLGRQIQGFRMQQMKVPKSKRV